MEEALEKNTKKRKKAISSINTDNINANERHKSSSSKSSNRLVHSIASGLKKGTKKIFKKNHHISKNDDDLLNDDNSGNKRGSFRRQRLQHHRAFRSGRRKRMRRKKERNGVEGNSNNDETNIRESESFSSPERLPKPMAALSPSESVQMSMSMQAMNGRHHRHHGRHQASIGGSILPFMIHNLSIVNENDDTIQSQVLRNFEYVMRKALFYIFIYLLGAYQPLAPILSNDLVLQFGHYAFIMWVTCVIIKFMICWATLQQQQRGRDKGSTRDTIVAEDLTFSDYEELGRQKSLEDEILMEEEEEEELEEEEEEDDDEEDELEMEEEESLVTSPKVTLSPREEEFRSPLVDSRKGIISRNNSFQDRKLDDDTLHSATSENENEVSTGQSWAQVKRVTKSDSPQHHPELEDLFIIDKMTNERLYPNGKPLPIENEMFKGNILFMFRTSDVDQKDTSGTTTSVAKADVRKGCASDNTISNYFRTKKRRFEIQMQFQFKKLPDSHSPLYMCCDIDEPIKLGLIQRAFVKATMNFVQQKNPSFSYSLSGNEKVAEDDKKAGKYEKPRLSFPVETSLDRLVVTKPGEDLPILGTEIYEDPEVMAKRKKGKIAYNKEDTYTFCLWSAYVDFLQWKVVNLPAIRPFSLANVNGAQSTSLKFYSLKSTSGKHFQCDMDVVADMEIGHRQMTTIGQGIKSWVDKRLQESIGISNPIGNNVKETEEVEKDNDMPNYKVDTQDDSDFDDDALSSDIEGIIVEEGPHDSDLEVMNEVDEEIFYEGSDTAVKNEIEIQSETHGNKKGEQIQYLPGPENYNVIDFKDTQEHNETSRQLLPDQVKKFKFDVPAWIEMTTRNKKKLQRVYVVRVMRKIDTSLLQETNDGKADDKELPCSFTRLRTGKQLNELARLGLELGIVMSKEGDPNSFDDELTCITQAKMKPTKRRGDHVAVSKTLKHTINLKSPSSKKSKILEKSHLPIAGEMNAPDQSCLLLSHIFSKLEKASKSMEQVREALSFQLSPNLFFDSCFLQGSTAELGALSLTSTDKIFGEFIVARCLWESHWREEACIIYHNRIEFYVPWDTKKSCFVISFCDVQDIRFLEIIDEKDPLMFPKLAIETHWKCHYLLFANNDKRENFRSILSSTMFSCPTDIEQNDEWQAHFWQGFHMNSLSNGFGKWAKISTGKKKYNRFVLNNRRMGFDCAGHIESFNSTREIGIFVEDLLRTALSFSLESLESSPDEFVTFQDKTSDLKNLSFQRLDITGKEAFCICVNLYHCLLQHSLLLSSAPTKKSIISFMRTHCYEIGGDVFSLAELECCVIRGRMSRLGPNPKPPFSREPKKSRHYMYALERVDPRISFVLNSGNTSKPRGVPILTPDTLEEKMKTISSDFLRNRCSFDTGRKVLTLPKVCEIYKNDFGTDARQMCAYLVKFLDENSQIALIDIINSAEHGSFSIKFEQNPDRFYSILKLLN